MRTEPFVFTVGVSFLALSIFAAAQEIQPRMGDPLPGLSASELSRFLAGKQVFQTPVNVSQGSGPIFNDTSCAGCHGTPAPGGSSQIFVRRFGKAANGPNPFDPLENLGGSLLQKNSIFDECLETVPVEADVNIKRITPPVFGFGLLEAIPDLDILDGELNPPAGVSGEVHWVLAFEDAPNPQFRAGRFGWKAQVATVLTFSADASLNEMGLTNRFLTQENAPNGNLALLAQCDTVADPEDGPDIEGFHLIDRQSDFQRFLAAPPQTPKNGMSGEALFNGVGCAACHVSSAYLTGSAPEAAISGKFVKPYSDFLLHDMGSLGDGIVQGSASETEFRTPPLWGVRQRASVALLHDGSATGKDFAGNLLSAIDAHDGEAAASRAQFQALSSLEKDQLIAFLDSLGRSEFDAEGDNDVDDIDWFFIQPDFSGPGNFYNADHPAALADFDQDGDIDLIDFGWMQRASSGQLP